MKRMHAVYKTVMLLILCVCLGGCSVASTPQDHGTATTTAVTTAPTTPPKPLAIDNETAYDAAGTRDVDIDAFMKTFVGIRLEGDGKLQEMYDTYGGVCLRETPDGTVYSVHKVEQGGILYVYYETVYWDRTIPIDQAGLYSFRWYYVCDDLSYADYEKHLQKNVTTVDDMIAFDAGVRIFWDHALANAKLWKDTYGYFCSFHYLNDGILEIKYRFDGDTAVVEDWGFVNDYQMHNFEGRATYYNLKVLDQDVIKSEHVLKTP